MFFFQNEIIIGHLKNVSKIPSKKYEEVMRKCVCSAPALELPFGLLNLNNVCYHHMSYYVIRGFNELEVQYFDH